MQWNNLLSHGMILLDTFEKQNQDQRNGKYWLNGVTNLNKRTISICPLIAIENDYVPMCDHAAGPLTEMD